MTNQRDAAKAVAWLYGQPDRRFGGYTHVSTRRLTDRERVGWTETPLYAHPDPSDQEKRIAELVEALATCERAIAEYYRYFTGGEMRGSYDGKPERQGLWNARHLAWPVLNRARQTGEI